MSKSQIYGDIFEQTVKSTFGAAGKVPEANRLRNVQEGKAHPLWLVGHLATTNSLMILKFCCEEKSALPREYNKPFSPDFAQGDPVVTDAAFYPPWDEVVANYKMVGDACVAAIRKLSDEDLASELRSGAPEQFKQIFGNIENTIRGIAGHDSHHRGQMAMLGALA